MTLIYQILSLNSTQNSVQNILVIELILNYVLLKDADYGIVVNMHYRYMFYDWII